MTTPGSTTARRLSGSIARIRFMREHSITTAPSFASAPPESPVPAPRGTNGTPCCAARAHDRLHLLRAIRGNTTAEGSAVCSVRPSHS